MFFFNRLRRLIDSVGMPQISTICAREEFSCVLERELARAERNNQVFSVVDFDIGDIETNRELGKQLLQALAKRLRSTDEVGWLHGHHIGVLLYNTPLEGAHIFSNRILELLPKVFSHPDFKIHTYPTGDQTKDDSSYQGAERRQTSQGSPSSQNVVREKSPKPVREMRMLYSLAMPTWKRSVDLVGALLLLIFFSPLLVLAALMIKIVSPGPIFFKQRRVGYGGRVFTLYKLRTMKVHADASAHQQYLADLIRETSGEKETGRPMVKLDDPQIIPFGKILRVTCIDELPQLINVFLGDMSLVGPRPPIPYEVEEYVNWYTGRFDAMPGMTGLWQVSGKNRLTFKDMARLDVRYARQMSFALDLKILIFTPLAIFFQIKDSLRNKKNFAKGVFGA
jgi:lipopolysaccharide/colanic/teichoic acid biosynthesis glycosyltransferase